MCRFDQQAPATTTVSTSAAAPVPTYEKTTRDNRLERGHATGPEPMPANTGPRQAAFRDEYGRRYDADGNRLDARGNAISPHTPQ
jgi:hypothetical protein